MVYDNKVLGRVVKSAMGLSIVVAASLFGFSASAQGEQPVLTITTGGANGNYYKIAEDMKKILPAGFRLEIETSDGSIQNLKRLIGFQGFDQDKYYQLAIVQGDVLEQLRRRAENDSVLKAIVDRIKVVMMLYGEEVHAFAPKKQLFEKRIQSFDDLINSGLKMAVGEEDSGTNVTARYFFEQSGADVSAMKIINSSGKPGLPSLGRIFGVYFYVSGAPTSIGNSINADQDITLVPIDLDGLYDDPDSAYAPAKIGPDDYDWLTEEIDTVAVNAFLITFDYDDRNPYCDLIEEMTRHIVDGMPADQAEQEAGDFHPKWLEVKENLRKTRNRGDLYECAERGLN